MRRRYNPYIKCPEDESTLAAHPPGSGIDWKSDEYEDIRNRIRTYLFVEQDFYCAYCAALIDTKTGDIDHFAPKDHYLSEMFTPENLLLSCTSCNRSKNQQRGFVHQNGTSYAQWSFTLVHPMRHDPTDHIVFDKYFVLMISTISTLGEKADEIFDISGPYKTAERAKALKLRGSVFPEKYEPLIAMLWNAKYRVKRR